MNYQMHLWRKIRNGFEGLIEICQKNPLDHQVPKKEKFVHGNHLSFYEKKKKKQYIGLRFAINISNKTDQNKRKYAK